VPSTQSFCHAEDSVVSASRVTQAQRVIADARNASDAERNKAIEEAIQLLYPGKVNAMLCGS